jgi:hypothetical protein
MIRTAILIVCLSAFTACVSADTLISEDTKCNSRLFDSKKSDFTKETCKAKCEATVDCETYAIKTWIDGAGYCMACEPGTAVGVQPGFDYYQLDSNSVLRSTSTHATATEDMRCSGAGERLFTKRGATRDTCKAECQNTLNCGAYSFNAKNFMCYGCTPDATHQGYKNFDMHELLHREFAKETKCMDGRVFHVEGQLSNPSGMTLETCKAKCADTLTCKTYSFNAKNGQCMGCEHDATQQEVVGFDMYELESTATKCSIECSLSSGILQVTHDTTSRHTTHKCFKNAAHADGCECECA